jgi:hypothetical protein
VSEKVKDEDEVDGINFRSNFLNTLIYFKYLHGLQIKKLTPLMKKLLEALTY